MEEMFVMQYILSFNQRLASPEYLILIIYT